MAIALTCANVCYRKVRAIVYPPEHLRQLPHVSFFTFFKALLSNITVDQFSSEVIVPITLQSNGAHVTPTIAHWSVHLTDPVAIKQLLVKGDMFPKSTINQGFPGTLIYRYIGGDNIVMLSGEPWVRHRKIANRAFKGSLPLALFGELTQNMFAAMDGLDNSRIDVLDLFERLTLDTIGRSGFDFDFHALDQRDNEWVERYNAIKVGILDPFFLIFSVFDTTLLNWFPKRRAVHQKLTEFLGMLDAIIEQRRTELEKGTNTAIKDEDKDLLTLMIESERTEGAGLSNEELRRNLCIFFLAGHDTTAFTLTAIIYELAHNPSLQERARQEVIDVLGDAPEDVIPTAQDTKRMPFLNAIMKETMRLHNPVLNTTVREVMEDVQLGNVSLPKGTLVSADILGVHRNPKCWNNPTKFDPERFMPGGENERQSGSGLAWIPFSHGGRICVGMNFSIAEQRTVLAMLLRKYTWSLPQDTVHKEGLVTHGVAFGIITTDDLYAQFEKRY
ncbi:cytochrome P-450 cyp509A1 [Hesseltinella vesiculosa]|uniref:Cytochrome P-450 cyp509A1 n=1 Tax=Hesseltinella vesiculosa TaxID=101127 RepID=A0A1X2GRA1_9FUNG|nr:cytochrome P-450 cyp509A1 [Hesseltinella vesiculosa]